MSLLLVVIHVVISIEKPLYNFGGETKELDKLAKGLFNSTNDAQSHWLWITVCVTKEDRRATTRSPLTVEKKHFLMTRRR